MTGPKFLGHFFCPKVCKMAQNMIFWNYWKLWLLILIWSIVKGYTICCVTVQILYLVKIWFLRYEISANQIALFQIRDISRTSRSNSLIFWWRYKVMKIKHLWKFLWVGMVRNGCGHSCHMTRRLAISQEWNEKRICMLIQIQKN